MVFDPQMLFTLKLFAGLFFVAVGGWIFYTSDERGDWL